MSEPKIGGLIVAPNGAQMWVAHDQAVHVSVQFGEPYARVYINGVDITPPAVSLEFKGTIDEVAAFDRALTREELERLRDA